jgi:hypothetical protein
MRNRVQLMTQTAICYLPHILQTDPSTFSASDAGGNMGSFLVVKALKV